MKKSLVAIAALTLVGAASAQVSLTGNVSFSSQSGLDGTRGLTMSDNSIFLGVTEDLGGGNKLTASTGFDAGGRNTTGGGNFGSENSSLTVAGSWGGVKIQSYESDGPLANVEGLSGASLDNGMFDSNAVGLAKRFRAAVTYSTPAFSGFTGALTYVQMAGNFTSSDPMDARTKVVPALTYQSGPLKAYIEDAFFNAAYPGTGNSGNTNNSITQPTVYATYDFGVANIGAGWTKASNSDATYILAGNVPVGALTFGLASATYLNSAATGNGTWTEASIAYSLSKRTTIKASFGVVNDAAVAYAQSGGALTATGGGTIYGLQGANYTTANESQTRVGLFHSF